MSSISDVGKTIQEHSLFLIRGERVGDLPEVSDCESFFTAIAPLKQQLLAHTMHGCRRREMALWGEVRIRAELGKAGVKVEEGVHRHLLEY